MQLTIGELYHIVMMITGVWAMIVSMIYLHAYINKNNNKKRNYRKKT